MLVKIAIFLKKSQKSSFSTIATDDNWDTQLNLFFSIVIYAVWDTLYYLPANEVTELSTYMHLFRISLIMKNLFLDIVNKKYRINFRSFRCSHRWKSQRRLYVFIFRNIFYFHIQKYRRNPTKSFLCFFTGNFKIHCWRSSRCLWNYNLPQKISGELIFLNCNLCHLGHVIKCTLLHCVVHIWYT